MPEIIPEIITENCSGLEPELGGVLRQNAVYVDESTCIGCGHCAHVARYTFCLEEDFGRARVIAQDGDIEDLVQEAIATCPVDCIHWVSYQSLQQLELARKDVAIQDLGILGDRSAQIAKRRRLNHLHKLENENFEPRS